MSPLFPYLFICVTAVIFRELHTMEHDPAVALGDHDPDNENFREVLYMGETIFLLSTCSRPLTRYFRKLEQVAKLYGLQLNRRRADSLLGRHMLGRYPFDGCLHSQGDPAQPLDTDGL